MSPTRKTTPRADASPPQSQRRAAGGLEAGVIELATDEAYKIRLLGGELIDARPAPGCSRELLDECLRDRRTVLLAGELILGALQTTASAARRDPSGNVSIEAAEIHLEASAGLSLRVEDSALDLGPDGHLRLSGQRLSIDVAALIKLLSARVELP